MNKMSTRADIVQLCMSIAQHTDKCYDFQIQHWLDQYMSFTNESINFSEAAFLISSTAQIYGRKVDFLEKLILEFNQRGAQDAAKMAAQIAAKSREDTGKQTNDKNNTENNDDLPNDDNGNKLSGNLKTKSTRLKKKLLKRGRFEFIPKDFETADISELSLNLNPAPHNPENDFGSPFRMKNYFPRINVLQCNMRTNNRFYESLELDEPDNDDADILRDFRLFMDTIDEPIPSIEGPNFQEIMSYDPTVNNGKRKRVSREEAQCIIYLPASYLKEQYDIELEDNNDYINMLRYNRELKRLKIAEMTIEEVMNCDFGTYLNDILHGTNESGKVEPLTKEEINRLMDEAKQTNHYLSSTLPVYDRKTKKYDTRPWDEYAQKSGMNDQNDDSFRENLFCRQISLDSTADSTDFTDEDMLHSSSSDECSDTAIMSSAHTTRTDRENEETTVLNASAISATESTLNGSENLNECRADASVLTDMTGDTLTDTIASTTDDTVEGEETRDHTLETENSETLSATIASDESLEMSAIDPCALFDELVKTTKAIPLTSNIFGIPEQLLRRPKIFQLTEDFELWLAARKRKSTSKPEPVNAKVYKMFDGSIIPVQNPMSDAPSCVSDDEDFYGFDELGNADVRPSISNNTTSALVEGRLSLESVPDIGFESFDCLHSTEMNSTDINTTDMFSNDKVSTDQPGVIVNRTCSNDSGVQVLLGTDSGIISDASIESQLGDSCIDQISDDDVGVYAKDGRETMADSGFSEIDSTIQSELPEPQIVELPVNGELQFDTSITTVTVAVPDTSLPEMQTATSANAPNEDDMPRLQRHSANEDQDVESTSTGVIEVTPNPCDLKDEEERRQIAIRVKEWHDQLKPVLQKCKERSNFDIHALGSDIINMFPPKEPQKQINFADIMEQRNPADNARYFLSLLLLTNTKNVHIERTNPELNGKTICRGDELNIRLISRARHLDSVNQIDKHLKRTASDADDV